MKVVTNSWYLVLFNVDRNMQQQRKIFPLFSHAITNQWSPVVSVTYSTGSELENHSQTGTLSKFQWPRTHDHDEIHTGSGARRTKDVSATHSGY